MRKTLVKLCATPVIALTLSTSILASPGEITTGRNSAGEITTGRTSAGEITTGRTSAGEITTGRTSAGEITTGRTSVNETFSFTEFTFVRFFSRLFFGF